MIKYTLAILVLSYPAFATTYYIDIVDKPQHQWEIKVCTDVKCITFLVPENEVRVAELVRLAKKELGE